MKRYKCVCNAFDFPMDAARNSVESGNVDSPAWDSLVWSGLLSPAMACCVALSCTEKKRATLSQSGQSWWWRCGWAREE